MTRRQRQMVRVFVRLFQLHTHAKNIEIGFKLQQQKKAFALMVPLFIF